MSNILLIIPFIFSILLLIFFKKRVKWWEYTILIISGIIINFIIVAIMKDYNCKDVQYLGDYIKEVRYYESWDEWVHRTCYRTYTDSKGHTHTESYDCSYRLFHPEEWVMISSGKKSYNIGKDDYERLIKLWKSPNRWVDMHRSFHTKDGDMYSSFWDNDYKTIIPITISNNYKNRIKGSKSVFNFEYISKSKAKEYGLYDYPELTLHTSPFPQHVYKNTYQKSLLGYDDPELQLKLNYINSIYGPSKHIRTYLLIFKDKPHTIGFLQKSYWEGGNFNEHIICLGLNSKTNNIDWCETFSWENNPKLAVNTKQWFIVNNKLDSLKNFPIWYESILNKNIWKCRDTKDFNYLKTELTNTQLIWLLAISLIICIGISLWALLNKYDNNVD